MLLYVYIYSMILFTMILMIMIMVLITMLMILMIHCRHGGRSRCRVAGQLLQGHGSEQGVSRGLPRHARCSAWRCGDCGLKGTPGYSGHSEYSEFSGVLGVLRGTQTGPGSVGHPDCVAQHVWKGYLDM